MKNSGILHELISVLQPTVKTVQTNNKTNDQNHFCMCEKDWIPVCADGNADASNC